MHKFPNSVSSGAKLLDKVKPNWFHHINKSNLIMDNGNLCILGQLFGAYTSGCKEIFGKEYQENAMKDRVFGTYVSTNAWFSEIDRRLYKNVKVMNFQAALGKLKKGEKLKRRNWTDCELYWKYDSSGNIVTDQSCCPNISSDDILANDWIVYKKPIVRLSNLKPGDRFKCVKYGEGLTLLKNKNVKLMKPYYLFCNSNHNLYAVSDDLVVQPFKGM